MDHGEVLGVVEKVEVEEEVLSDSHRVEVEGDRCIHGGALTEEVLASHGGAWGLGDPWEIQKVVLGAAFP